MLNGQRRINRRLGRWLIAATFLVCVAGLFVWRDYQRRVRAQEFAREIEVKGGQVQFAPSLIGNLAAWWSAVMRIDWKKGTTVELLGDTHLDTTWLQERDDLADLRITNLYIDQSALANDDVIRLIARHPLQYFVGFGQQSADAIAAALAEKAQLTLVQLQDADLTDDGLRRLPLEQLEYLCVERTPVTASGLSDLRRCRNLTYLSIDGHQLDESVVAIVAELPALKRVALVGPAIGDENVHLIAALQKLPVINLQQTSVTKAGATKLRQSMPATNIGVE